MHGGVALVLLQDRLGEETYGSSSNTFQKAYGKEVHIQQNRSVITKG